MAEKPSITEALAAVMAEIDAVGKNDRNQQQNYSFRGVDAVVNAVGPALRKHGVIMAPHAGTPTEEHYQSKSGAAMTRIVLPVTFTFHGPAGDSIDCLVYGESSDSGDKAMPKAHSVAWRVAMLQVFAIPTDDPDPDASAHERASVPQEPAIDWRKLGWEDQAEYDEEYAELAATARTLDATVQQSVKDYLAQFSKPYSRDVSDGWRELLADLAPVATPLKEDQQQDEGTLL